MADKMTARASERADESERDGDYSSGGGRGFEHVSLPLNRVLAGSGLLGGIEQGAGGDRLRAARLPGNASAAVPPRWKGRPETVTDRALEGQPDTWFSAAQMSREAARALFDYRPDGRLFWRELVGRRRPEAGGEFYRKRLDAGPIWTIQLGSRANVTRYMRRTLVWNWHFGGTDRVLLPINGDTLDDRVENIRLGARLEGLAADVPLGAAVAVAETGVTCPCCGAMAPVLSPNLIARAYELPPQQEAILARVWQGRGKPVTGEAIISEMYADDEDGGPEYETARKYFKTQLCLLRKRIEGSGVRIEVVGYQRGFKLVLGPGGEGGKPEGGSVSGETGEG
ncbi:hypothetical protein [Pleomorphomonas sp. PLEO]|uniref:hypothetical protein n=1 Tax=Pleomorphomonas sp. PLEO TaxID=3239306 RepID=UPI00351DCE83